MRIRFATKSIAFRLLIVTLCAMLLLFELFDYAIVTGSNKAVSETEQSTFFLLGDIIRWTINDSLLTAQLAMASLLHDNTIVSFFKARNREGLYKYMLPFYLNVKDRIPRIHFHLPDGTSFLRVHKPESFGDPIAMARPLIARALQNKSSESGIEIGRDGLGLRVITPLYSDNQFLGLMEFSMDFGDVFIYELKKRFSGDYYIFLFTKTDYELQFVTGTRFQERCPLAEKNIAVLKQGKKIWSLDCANARAVGLYPFTDYAGTPIGFIKTEFDAIPIADAMKDIWKKMRLYGMLLLVVLVIVIAVAMEALLKPLSRVVNQARSISECIIAGDTSSRGDITETALEFQPIIRAINDIIYALKERESILQAIVQGIPGIVYYVDASMKVLWANEKAQTIAGDIIGKDIRTCANAFFEQDETILNAVFASKAVQMLEACYIDQQSQTTICWEHVAVPVFDDSKTVSNVIRISTDISQRIKAEKDLRLLNEELEKRVENEVQLRQEGERIANQQSRLAAIGELATGMAHEITQPLNAIAFTFENLRARFIAKNLDAEYFEIKTKALETDIERIRRVIDHVRLFARSAPEEYRVAFSPETVIENALSLTGVQLASHGITIIKNISPIGNKIIGNAFKYEQVVLNLISNARDAIEERVAYDSEDGSKDNEPGVIKISLYEEDNYIKLAIEDNGTGINEKYRTRVFDPFFSTKAPGRGTGLGLSIAFGIVRDMGGTIELLPAPQHRGTLAIVSIPKEEKADE